MIRTLLIVAAASLVLTVACVGGAIALGGADIAAHGWQFGPSLWRFGWEQEHDWSGPEITKEIPWSAGRQLAFIRGAEIHFHQGPEHKVLATGPAGAVNNLHMEDGRLDIGYGSFGAPPPVRLDITAPDIDTFKIFGSSDLSIDGYDQGRLVIEINGNGDVNASGKAGETDVTIRGSGDVDVSRLASDEARVEIMGSGDATIAPTQTADIDIAGSGNVTLLSDPPNVRTDIKGSGRIDRRPAAPEPPSPAQSAAPAGPHAAQPL